MIARPKAHTSAPVRVVFQAVLGGLQTDFFPSLRLSRPLTMMMLYFCVACMAMLGWAVRSGTHTTLAGALDFAAIGCLTLTWLAVLCILVREIGQSRSANASQWADRRGLAVLVETARSWPRNRSTQIEPIFIAAGGETLDNAGSREVIQLLASELPAKPSLLLLFFAPGAGAEHRVVEVIRDDFASMDLAKAAADSLWIPLHRADSWMFVQSWPLEKPLLIAMHSRAAGVFALMGSGSSASREVPVEPRFFEHTSQLATELALRWARMQREQPPAASSASEDAVTTSAPPEKESPGPAVPPNRA